jgi:hypothetical protein
MAEHERRVAQHDPEHRGDVLAPHPVGNQELDRRGVERDAADGMSLRVFLDDAAAAMHDAPPDLDHAADQVDVRPLQGDQLTAPGTGHSGQKQEGRQRHVAFGREVDQLGHFRW